jgi:hypothetical protein
VSDYGPNRGEANITFDGNVVGNMNLYSPTRKYRKIVWERGLRTGSTHTVQITITGADPSSIRSIIDVDGLAVFFNTSR